MATKYRSRLTTAETGMYDLMLSTSDLLKQVAHESSEDLAARLYDEFVEAENDIPDAAANVVVYLHNAVTYAFTLGIQFAVNRQQEMARQVAQQMGLVPKES